MLPSSVDLLPLLQQAYAKAYAYHSDLELDAELFRNQVLAIIAKHRPAESTNSAPVNMLMRLHTDDLYLTLACAQAGEEAWERLDSLYRGDIKRLAYGLCGNRHQAAEMAQDTLTHLFLTDKAGKKRIASYQGLSSLANWLAIIIQHRAIEVWKSPFHHFEPIDMFFDVPDEVGTQRIENATRSKQYSQMANDSLRKACRVLNERDRWFLTLRYEKELQVKKVAELAKLDPTTIAYHIQRAQEKLRKEICSILKKEYNLNEFALQECIEEIIANPAYSLLNLMRAA
jgi:RNA polymerase sigma-70 factor